MPFEPDSGAKPELYVISYETTKATEHWITDALRNMRAKQIFGNLYLVRTGLNITLVRSNLLDSRLDIGDKVLVARVDGLPLGHNLDHVDLRGQVFPFCRTQLAARILERGQSLRGAPFVMHFPLDLLHDLATVRVLENQDPNRPDGSKECVHGVPFG